MEVFLVEGRGQVFHEVIENRCKVNSREQIYEAYQHAPAVMPEINGKHANVNKENKNIGVFH